MERKAVKSSNIVSVGYDHASKTLEVEFKSGGVYRYADVTPERHAAMMAAPSVGSFHHTHFIKTKHPHTKE
jgi:hypothetical protein